MAMKTLAFGAMPPRPIADRELFDAECRRMNTFYNALIELYRGRRVKVREVLNRYSPDLARLEGELEAIEGELQKAETATKAAAARGRSRKDVPAELRQAVSDLRKKRKETRTAASAARALVRGSKEAKGDLEAVDEWLRVEANERAGKSGIFWPNKTQVRFSADLANKTSFKEDPRFKSFARADRFVIVCPTNVRADVEKGRPQSGCTLEQLYANASSYVRIQADPKGRHRLKRGGRRFRRERRVLVSVRVATENNLPVFVTVPVTLSGLDRFTKDTLIREVRVVRQRIGLDWVWGVRFVVWYPDPDRTPHLDERLCAVDVGWRLIDKDLRVAYWRGNDGRSGEWRIKEGDLGRFEEGDRLRRRIDLRFNEVLPKVLEWRENGGVVDALPEDHPVREYLSHAGLWKSPRRVYELERLMREHKVADGHPIRVLVRDFADFWVKMFKWLTHGTQQHLDWRKNLYYCLIKELRQQYDTVAIEDIDWPQFYRRPDESDDSPVLRGVRGMMRVAVPGTIHQLLDQRFPVCLRAEAKHTTAACHACGHIDADWDQATELFHTCSGCGTRWDQDDNACHNLMARATEAVVPYREKLDKAAEKLAKKQAGRAAASAARKKTPTEEEEADDGEFDAGLDAGDGDEAER